MQCDSIYKSTQKQARVAILRREVHLGVCTLKQNKVGLYFPWDTLVSLSTLRGCSPQKYKEALADSMSE